jgi:hypothetical protein
MGTTSSPKQASAPWQEAELAFNLAVLSVTEGVVVFMWQSDVVCIRFCRRPSLSRIREIKKGRI